MKAVVEALDFLKTDDQLGEIEEIQNVSKKDMTDYLAELNYCVTKRKLLERDKPVGHLVLPTYRKLKRKLKSAENEVSKE